MRLTKSCSICSKPLELLHSTPLVDGTLLNEYKCGHIFVETKQQTGLLDFTSVLGDKSARRYQEDGIRFIIESDFCCIIGDQMRLGKTPQALIALRNRYADKTPCLILVRSANLYQWIAEYKTWTDPLPAGILPITGSKSFIMPGFKTYIISMDTFSRKGMVEKLLAFGFKLVIVDEAHSFKNTDSNRSQALVKFLHEISESELVRVLHFHCAYCSAGWDKEIIIKVNVQKGEGNASYTTYDVCPKCGARIGQSATKSEKHERKCGIVMLTGTPIKNRADEFFVPLNLVAPTRFRSMERFRREWLTQDTKGKWSKVNPYRLDSFREHISDVYLRREKEDVYADTPLLNRMYSVIEIEDEHIKKLYNQELAAMELKVAQAGGQAKFFDLQDNMMVLRRICGMAKVKWAAEYVDLALETDATLGDKHSKMAIGIHHVDVKTSLVNEIGPFRCETLTGSDSAEQKYRVMRDFETNDKRVLVMNMLAGGVGMDFHYLDNVLILERMWSSADEEQFEFRFYNPDRSIKDRPTNIEYVIAKGTLDNWWYDMVQQKRQIFGETIGNNWDISQDPASFQELIEKTIGNRI